MSKWIDQLLPLIMDMLQDSSSLQKREVALCTLGHLVESTGIVVEPYSRYPTLLDVLLNFLKTEQSHSIRREVRSEDQLLSYYIFYFLLIFFKYKH